MDLEEVKTKLKDYTEKVEALLKNASMTFE